jgi:two-component system, NarL family, nitrate/nitrite response regulator NarL
VTLLVADVYAATRAGVRATVEPFGFEVVAEAADAAGAVDAAKREQPRVCLLAIDLPGGGLKATRRILEALPSTAVVVRGASPSGDDLADAIAAGASGYVPPNTAVARLPNALNSALEGDVSVALSLIARVVQRGESSNSERAVLPGIPAVRLTPRERQVFEALLENRSTAEIAALYDISQVTVRRYTSDLLRKIGVADRAELLALWRETDSE